MQSEDKVLQAYFSRFDVEILEFMNKTGLLPWQ